MSNCKRGKVCTARAEGLVRLLSLVVNLLLTVLVFFFLLPLLILSLGPNEGNIVKEVFLVFLRNNITEAHEAFGTL